MLETVIKRHSKLGIASMIIGAGLPLLVVILSFNTIVWDRGYYNKTDFTDSMKNLFLSSLGIVLLIALPLHLTGLIFALVGFFSKKTKNSFPIAGIVLNLIFGLLGTGIGILLIYSLLSIPWR